MVYGIIILIIVIWLVLSFTIWGNPSAGERAMQLLEAANARDKEAFVACFQTQSLSAAGEMYERVASYLGGGSYDDIGFYVDQPNEYDAYAYLDSGSVQTAGGEIVSLSRSNNLVIYLESHEGRWWAVIKGTDIMP
jgi:hypothetical protein